MSQLEKAITGWANELAHQTWRVQMTDDERSQILGDIMAAVGAGMPVGDACEQAGITKPTYYAWRRRHSRRLPAQHTRPDDPLDADQDDDATSDAGLMPPPDELVPLNLPPAMAKVAIEAVVEAAREAIIVAIDEFKTGASVLDVSGIITAVRQYDDVLRQLGRL